MKIYTAGCVSNRKNCMYPNLVDVCCADDLSAAVAFDHVCASYKDNRRSVENFMSSDVVVMDCDNDRTEHSGEWITPDMLDAIFPGVSYAAVTSRNHMKVKDGISARPRFHVYFQIPECSDAKAYAAMKTTIHQAFPMFDDNALDAARFIYGCQAETVIWHEGETDIMSFIARIEREDREFAEMSAYIPAGRRNSTLSHFAGRVLKRYGDGENAVRLFRERASCCTPPLDEDELERIWSSALKFYAKVKQSEGYLSPEEYKASLHSLWPQDFSDMGEAKVFVAEYGNEVAYTSSTGFIRYNGTYWEESGEKAVGAMEEFLDLQFEDARAAVEKAAGEEKMEKAADAYMKFVRKRRQFSAITAALNASKPMVLKHINDLDRDGFLLNTPDMTYDLRHGMSGGRAPSASDYITRHTLVPPGEQGREDWLGALQLFFMGNDDLIEYVQRVVGLTAIGKVYQEALIIAHGGGRNGKSTFWNSIARVLGSYSGMISADALTVGCKRNVKPEMAELKGMRLVIAAELEEGMRLNTSIIKQLCSTDPIAAEKKYKDPFKFMPSHTLVLYTNHLPKVGAIDEGTWRRLKVIPFNAKIEGKSDIKNYTEHLVEKCGPYILKWIIEGAEKVIADGFQPREPKCVLDAIKAYRADNDWISRFISECCDVSPEFQEKSGELYAEYRSYCQGVGDFIRHVSDFSHAMEDAGFTRKKLPAGMFFRGCRIKSDIPF